MNDNYLIHYGVKGMKWGVHSNNIDSRKLAEKNGFIRDKNYDYDKTWIAYSKKKK